MKKLLLALGLSLVTFSSYANIYYTIDEDAVICSEAKSLNLVLFANESMGRDAAGEVLYKLLEEESCGFAKANLVGKLVGVEGSLLRLQVISLSSKPVLWLHKNQANAL